MSSLDLAGLRLARTVGHAPGLERAVARFSRLGEHGAIWLVVGAAGAGFDDDRRGRWLRALAIVIGAYLLNTGLKLVFRRGRPQVPGLPPLVGTPTGLSFPSAHAATCAAAAQAFDGLLPRGPLRGLAVALPASRLYLGVHWPSDVIAGGLLGTAVGALAP